jgi:hypothetical protein
MSGLDGLSGMKEVSLFPIAHPENKEVLLGSPLLAIPKVQICLTPDEAHCHLRGVWSGNCE